MSHRARKIWLQTIILVLLTEELNIGEQIFVFLTAVLWGSRFEINFFMGPRVNFVFEIFGLTGDLGENGAGNLRSITLPASVDALKFRSFYKAINKF